VMDDELSPRLRELVSTRMLDRARVLGASMRLAYVVSAAMPGILAKTSLAVERHRLALHLPGSFSSLAGERVLSRLRSLARLIGREPVMLMG
jgi:exopolyphosphatase/guanosine-5'-triphosphate,3'-diphosphate pyrophosphatase